jgi:hypothetical protein
MKNKKSHEGFPFSNRKTSLHGFDDSDFFSAFGYLLFGNKYINPEIVPFCGNLYSYPVFSSKILWLSNEIFFIFLCRIF